MKPAKFDYHTPGSIEEAFELLVQNIVKAVLAAVEQMRAGRHENSQTGN
jgi:hypothetical protein